MLIHHATAFNVKYNKKGKQTKKNHEDLCIDVYLSVCMIAEFDLHRQHLIC